MLRRPSTRWPERKSGTLFSMWEPPYEALSDLKQARSGVYLAPLRLLAMEVQERMLEEGIFCSLLTGEEEDILHSATVLSATVEKLDVSHPYEVAVIYMDDRGSGAGRRLDAGDPGRACRTGSCLYGAGSRAYRQSFDCGLPRHL